MSTLDEFRQRFQAVGLTPDSVREFKASCEDEFMRGPTLAWFTLWSLFRSLSDLWDDGQAIPAAESRPYVELLQPGIELWIQTDSSFNDNHQMESVLRTFRDCHARAAGSGS